MNTIFELFMTNIYLYICIIIALIILVTILLITISNRRNRKKIKDDFIQAKKVESEISEEKNNELEQILKKMQEETNVKPEDVVKKFEEEQEEKAIISYKELVDNVKSGKIEINDDEDNSINFVENLNLKDNYDSNIEESEVKVTPDMLMDAINTISTGCVREEPKKFKNSEFISPIYGVMDNKLEYPTVKKTENTIDIMNTRDYDKLTEDIKRQEEFLEALKAFKNNL